LRGTKRVGARRLSVVIRIVPIPAPLPDIPVHIVEAPGIRTLLTHWMGLVVRVGGVPGELAQECRIVTEAVSGRAPRPAGILPLRLRRQPIALTTRLYP